MTFIEDVLIPIVVISLFTGIVWSIISLLPNIIQLIIPIGIIGWLIWRTK